MAWLIPTTRGRNHDDAASGTMPTRPNTKPNRADSAAMRTSMGSVIVAPTPTAGPLTAAITGLRSAANARLTTPPASRGYPAMSSRSSGGRCRVNRSAKVSAPPPRSAPAQNPRPDPVTTTTRTSSSASAAAATRTSSSAIVGVKAFSRSGRCSRIVAIRSATS